MSGYLAWNQNYFIFQNLENVINKIFLFSYQILIPVCAEFDVFIKIILWYCESHNQYALFYIGFDVLKHNAIHIEIFRNLLYM